MAAPTTTRAWSIREINADNFDGLELKESVPLPNLGDHDVLVKIEAVSLNYRELAIPRVGSMVNYGAMETLLTLCCRAFILWHALYGLQSEAVRAGDWVLTQDTGGVSLAVIQFAVAAGATGVATTSSNDKVDALKKLGASHVINYREKSNWGEVARALTPKGLGFDHILEIGGAASIAQSLEGIRLGGVITIIGFLTSSYKQPALMEAPYHLCIVRGIFVGSEVQFEEIDRAIDSIKMKRVVESKILSFEQVKKAY
ncbi:hypothetical protein ACHAO9_011339 [Fusarium lateritium]